MQATRPHHPVSLHPSVIVAVVDDGASKAVGPVRIGTAAAAVVMIKFSGDRPIEITRAFEQGSIASFELRPSSRTHTNESSSTGAMAEGGFWGFGCIACSFEPARQKLSLELSLGAWSAAM